MAAHDMDSRELEDASGGYDRLSIDDWRFLARAWARHVVKNHAPRTTAEGLTCDEAGCSICNADSPRDAEELLFDHHELDIAEPLLPDGQEMLELAEDLCRQVREELGL